MIQNLRVELEDHASAETLFEPICQLYREAFSQPPFNRSEAQHQAQADQLRQLLTNPTFGLSTAYVGDELVGFLYGIRLRPGTAWWDNFPRTCAGRGHAGVGGSDVRTHLSGSC
jgi:hypothetical protein